MKAFTNPNLQQELEAARLAARSFVGADEKLKEFLGKAIECLVNDALRAGPDPVRNVLLEQANGIRWVADMLNETTFTKPQSPAFG